MNFDHVFACLERASQLSDDVARACDAATALVEWRRPAMSAASLLTLLALALLTDGEHAIAVPFLVALAAMADGTGTREEVSRAAVLGVWLLGRGLLGRGLLGRVLLGRLRGLAPNQPAAARR